VTIQAFSRKSEMKTGEAESAYAWLRLFIALTLGTIGSVGLWSVVVALPTVQADFVVARAEASIPFTCAMIGFGLGAVFMGQVSDRFSILPVIIFGAFALGAGYIAASYAPNLWTFALASAVAWLGQTVLANLRTSLCGMRLRILKTYYFLQIRGG
jgi:MFS family permease